MVLGVICACCGKRGEREELTDTADDPMALFMCSPCLAEPERPPPLDLSVHTIPAATPVVVLEATKAFEGLSEKEQRYALALSRADWEGSKICLLQCSAESAPIFSLLQLVFSAQPVAELLERAKAKGITDEEAEQAMIYAAAFYGNIGNYKSFGDTKFVPALPAERFQVFLSASVADEAKVKELWDECMVRMYSLPPRQRQMGLGAKNGISTYFSANCDEQDAEVAGSFLQSIGLSPYNTRLFKGASGEYTVLLASSRSDSGGDDPVGKLCCKHDFNGKSFTVRRGDYGPLMARVVSSLEDALPHAANDEQEAMLKAYIESFRDGSIEAHKTGSRHWIKDTGPAVESYIGFIESYRDPSGARGEWEGFVACVNREVSRKFGVLVDGAEEMLKLMPWDSAFEKDKFMRPDFTSLEILSFGSSGVPAGINIPNYDDIRQSEGFKNVNLGNVLAASYGSGDKPVTFVAAADQELFKALKGEAFEVQVGIHELLGHGSGKLYHADTEDAKKLCGTQHPLTGKPIDGPFYAKGATWDTTFGKLASAYEECRAECSGIYLCLEQKVLTIFGHEPTSHETGVHDIIYINWLLMVRAGLTGLEFYTPETGEWRQAHMRARYVILRVLLEAGDGLVSLEKVTGSDGEPDLEVRLERSKIPTVGKAAIGRFLLSLQVHKSLGDLAAGTELFEKYSVVPPEMAAMREIVMARKEPRKLLLQPHLHLGGDSKPALQTFPATPAGMVESFVARFPAEDPELLGLYRQDLPHVAD